MFVFSFLSLSICHSLPSSLHPKPTRHESPDWKIWPSIYPRGISNQPPPEEKIAKTDKKKEKELLLPFLITRMKPAFILNQGALCSLHLGTMLPSYDSQRSLCDGRKSLRNIRREKTFIWKAARKENTVQKNQPVQQHGHIFECKKNI